MLISSMIENVNKAIKRRIAFAIFHYFLEKIFCFLIKSPITIATQKENTFQRRYINEIFPLMNISTMIFHIIPIPAPTTIT
jgi:hypothetical protein